MCMSTCIIMYLAIPFFQCVNYILIGYSVFFSMLCGGGLYLDREGRKIVMDIIYLPMAF